MATEKHVGKDPELRKAFEKAVNKAPPGGTYKAEIYVTTTSNPIHEYIVALTPGAP